MPPRTVGDVVNLDKPPEDAPVNPEAASDAIESLAFTDEAPQPAPPELVPAAKPKRRTKSELEAEVQRLSAEIEQQRAQAAAHAPDIIAAAKAPLMLTFRAGFDIMASWRGEHWHIEEQSANMLADAWAPCIGSVLAKHPEAIMWAGAIAVTYSVVYPRIQMDKTIAQREKEQAELRKQAGPLPSEVKT